MRPENVMAHWEYDDVPIEDETLLQEGFEDGFALDDCLLDVEAMATYEAEVSLEEGELAEAEKRAAFERVLLPSIQFKMYQLANRHILLDREWDDVFQELAQRVWQQIKGFDPSRGVKMTTYLNQCGNFAVMDMVKADKVRNKKPLQRATGICESTEADDAWEEDEGYERICVGRFSDPNPVVLFEDVFAAGDAFIHCWLYIGQIIDFSEVVKQAEISRHLARRIRNRLHQHFYEVGMKATPPKLDRPLRRLSVPEIQATAKCLGLAKVEEFYGHCLVRDCLFDDLDALYARIQPNAHLRKRLRPKEVRGEAYWKDLLGLDTKEPPRLVNERLYLERLPESPERKRLIRKLKKDAADFKKMARYFETLIEVFSEYSADGHSVGHFHFGLVSRQLIHLSLRQRRFASDLIVMDQKKNAWFVHFHKKIWEEYFGRMMVQILRGMLMKDACDEAGLPDLGFQIHTDLFAFECYGKRLDPRLSAVPDLFKKRAQEFVASILGEGPMRVIMEWDRLLPEG